MKTQLYRDLLGIENAITKGEFSLSRDDGSEAHIRSMLYKLRCDLGLIQNIAGKLNMLEVEFNEEKTNEI